MLHRAITLWIVGRSRHIDDFRTPIDARLLYSSSAPSHVLAHVAIVACPISTLVGTRKARATSAMPCNHMSDAHRVSQ